MQYDLTFENIEKEFLNRQVNLKVDATLTKSEVKMSVQS